MSLVEAWTGVGTDRWRQGGGCAHVCGCACVCVFLCVCARVCDLSGTAFELADGMIMVENDLKEHSSKRATSFFYVSVSLVLWSGNHLDGRKIGHCKLKLDNLLFLLWSIRWQHFPLNCCFVFVCLFFFLLFQGYEFMRVRRGGDFSNK